jgi:hypothetical protein
MQVILGSFRQTLNAGASATGTVILQSPVASDVAIDLRWYGPANTYIALRGIGADVTLNGITTSFINDDSSASTTSSNTGLFSIDTKPADPSLNGLTTLNYTIKNTTSSTRDFEVCFLVSTTLTTSLTADTLSIKEGGTVHVGRTISSINRVQENTITTAWKKGTTALPIDHVNIFSDQASITFPTAGTYIINGLTTATDDFGNLLSSSKNITITVTADTTPPVLTLRGDNPLTLSQGDTFVDPGATAIDDVDGDISANITTTGTVDTPKAGTYSIKYQVSDKKGNTSAVTRQVIVKDTAPPVIQLKGFATINLNRGSLFVDPGATATDSTDGDLTSSIVVNGSVDTHTIGTYVITYSVKDAAGNQSSVERTIHINRAQEFFHLDFNPSPGHRYTKAKNGLHQWVPIDVNQESYSTVEAPSNELLVKNIHVYLRPTSIWVKEGDQMNMIEGTARNQAIYHTDEPQWFEPDDYLYDPTMLRLGKFSVQANSDMKKDMVILDTRTRGGGLDEALSKEIIAQINKESLYHWDIGFFDGEAYQENGVMIHRLPRSILQSPQNPDGFKESDVQAAVAKYKAYGALPIIEYYDPETLDLNILGNFEFTNGKHITQYNPLKSTGVNVIDADDLGNGNDCVMKLVDDATYCITIPSTLLKHEKYELQLKMMLGKGSSARQAGKVFITYASGFTQTIPLSNVSSTDWVIYQTQLSWNASIQKVEIILNQQDSGKPDGMLITDYVRLIPVYETNTNMEVIEV